MDEIKEYRPETREQALERITQKLTEAEAHALGAWQKSGQPPIAPVLAAKLYNLFLNGHTCSQIRKMNQTLTLGQIVAARIEGDWDKRRLEYQDHLLNKTTEQVQQATLEAAGLMCDMLAVADRQYGDKLREYLQNGDEEVLGDFRITSLAGMQKAVEILQKLTGQDRQTKTLVGGEVTHRIESGEKPPTPEDAQAALKQLLGKKG